MKLARSDPDPDAKRQATHRLSESERETTFTDLEQIYAADQNGQLRRIILDAYSRLKNTKAAEKLFEIARQSDNKEMRRHAIHLIGEKAGRRSLEALRQTVDGDATAGDDVQVQMQAVQAIGQRPPDEAIPLLIKVARTHESTMVRKRAIQRLGELEDERVLAFFSEILK
ncbi:MAG: HEAT repeat domain-containing protein [Pyrinomonadaceae bacterium]